MPSADQPDTFRCTLGILGDQPTRRRGLGWVSHAKPASDDRVRVETVTLNCQL
jgi:hypothetical protein